MMLVNLKYELFKRSALDGLTAVQQQRLIVLAVQMISVMAIATLALVELRTWLGWLIRLVS